MGDLPDFLSMGGYAAFVWPAYGLAAAVLIGLLWTSLRALRASESALQSMEDGGRGPRRGNSRVP